MSATMTHNKPHTRTSMTPEQIRAIYGKRRTKGEYAILLNTLLTQWDEPAVNATDGSVFPTLVDKVPGTVKQGFDNAAKKLDVQDQIDVIRNEDDVFILVKSRINEMNDTTDTDSDTDDLLDTDTSE